MKKKIIILLIYLSGCFVSYNISSGIHRQNLKELGVTFTRQHAVMDVMFSSLSWLGVLCFGIIKVCHSEALIDFMNEPI